MNGAQSLMGSLDAAGVTVCFANPGTSELHLVAALDETPGIRGVLCLFEGVATGAADGFARMSSNPAATLLHQGPGLANGLANLHNAQRARTPVLNIVGASATTHRALNAPLESDVPALAAPMSRWVRTAASAEAVGADAVAALQAAHRYPRGVATLIVPADVAWSPNGEVSLPVADVPPSTVPTCEVNRVANLLRRGSGTTLLLGGTALRQAGLAAARRIGEATGIQVMAEAFPARFQRGAGVSQVPQLSGDSIRARVQLANTRLLVLVDATMPVAAFGAPGVRGELIPLDCVVDRLGNEGDDVVTALAELADVLAPNRPLRGTSNRPPPRTRTAPQSILAAIAEPIATLLPEDAIVVDEANTASPALSAAMDSAARHDLLSVCGFAIGEGLPLSIGAAMACPQRQVVCLQADGSAMYTISALWTQARERLNVTTIVMNNCGYSILRREDLRIRGVEAAASELFDLTEPNLDFVALSIGMGVPAVRARSANELANCLRRAFAEPGPHLIDVSIADYV